MHPHTKGLNRHTNKHGYTVPDITYKDPNNRRLRVVTIGTGFSGVLLAYKLKNETENVEHVMYEKNGDIGGTWLENKYPNCACDVPSHSYTYNFALNPFWPELYSKSDQIWIYLDRVCRAFDLRKYMHFNSRVIEAKWSEDDSRWDLKIEQSYADETKKIVYDHCDVLLQVTGLLNHPIVPSIEGLENFRGRVLHTAQWPDDYGESQWKGQRMVIIGAGSSSVQTTPGVQPHVKHLDIFIRSKAWLASAQPDNVAKPTFSKNEQEEFLNDKAKLVSQARIYEEKVNMIWKAMLNDSPEQKVLQERSREKMRKHLKRPELIEALTPDFPVGCRRTTPGVPFMEALTQPNVNTHFTAVSKITETSVIGEDGTEVKDVDAIVMATGFDTTYRPHFDVIGQNGISLRDKFTPDPDSYLSMAVPGFPNFITFFGPTFPVLAGSVTASLTAIADFAIKMINKIQAENLRGLAPKQSVTDQFNTHVQTALHGFVWSNDCNSWYTRRDGRVTAVWPGSALHYQDVVSSPRWEDWEITYKNPHNMWAYLGLGFTKTERDPKADKAPYLTVDCLDPAFYNLASTPLFEGKPPTAEEARKRSLTQPPGMKNQRSVVADH
ncbi:hypothetical protein HBH98_219190 [Parastagonospora nodorum]|nr:hypothetical protein HBH53_213500 [Parastagonospora nodorum]KAH3958290.1 hypothetical protein HBH51_212890 [Parastagonospora nodorum]KAH3962219.1 hypothetical protein HBH52_227220 [Parastagonospora nodorum]KAH4016015.1 hypothetical protein HBI09_204750 [Parastagonospora nodorum]KAH4043451.1 hypothetical protein HBH49_230550 [Parastagonospora nodorum]